MIDAIQMATAYLPDVLLYGAAFLAASGLRATNLRAAQLVRVGAVLMIAQLVLGAVVQSILSAQMDGARSYSTDVGFHRLNIGTTAISFMASSLLLLALFIKPVASPNEPRNYFGRIALAVALLVLYAAVPIAAGHGVGTVGLLVFLGTAQEWQLGQAFGFVGALSLLGAVIAPTSSYYLAVMSYGAACLGVSILGFAVQSEALLFSLAASIPFFVLATVTWIRCRNSFRVVA